MRVFTSRELTALKQSDGSASPPVRASPAVPRVSPVAVEVLIAGLWTPGKVRTCEISPDGHTCSAVVSYGPDPTCVTTRRFDAAHMRDPSGRPGCPAVHEDATCCSEALTSV